MAWMQESALRVGYKGASSGKAMVVMTIGRTGVAPISRIDVACCENCIVFFKRAKPSDYL